MVDESSIKVRDKHLAKRSLPSDLIVGGSMIEVRDEQAQKIS